MRAQYEIMNKRLEQVSAVLADLQQRDDNLYRTIFEADPIPSSVRKAGYGGINKYSDLEGHDNSDIIIETARKLDAAREALTGALRRKKDRSEELLRALKYERALIYEDLSQRRRVVTDGSLCL